MYNQYFHLVTGITNNTTSVDIVSNNSTDIGNQELFRFRVPRSVKTGVTGSPVPVTININGTAVPLKNKLGLQIQSNRIPRYGVGYYVAPTTEPATDSYLILLNTPVYVEQGL